MDSDEFEYWKAFNILEPIGIYREDLIAGNIAKSIYDAQFGNHGLGLDSFMLFRQKQERTKEQMCNDIKAKMAFFM